MSDNTQPFTPGGAPAARAAVEQLKAYSAPLEGRRQMLRLDFNENTIGPSPLVAQARRAFAGSSGRRVSFCYNHVSSTPLRTTGSYGAFLCLGSSTASLDKNLSGFFTPGPVLNTRV